MTVLQSWLPEFDDETARTRVVLAAVPADRWDWRPHDDLHTLAWNAAHLANIVGWTTGILEEDEFDLAQHAGDSAFVGPEADPAAVLAAFDGNRRTARAAIAACPDSALNDPWTLTHGEATLFTMPRGACLRRWVFNHSVHHRAILSAGLRSAGVALTPVYDG